MFSGIVEKLARISSVAHEGQTLVLSIETQFGDLELGESVAVNGVCLTVVEFSVSGLAKFFVSPETTARSNLGRITVGSLVNLERSVRLETRLSGHLVQGHVDGQGVLETVTPEGGAYLLRLNLPEALGRYCVEKGSIALNGISLTLNSVEKQPEGCVIGLTIIPHTWDHTNLNTLKPGDPLNVEVDVIAKYVESLCLPYLKP